MILTTLCYIEKEDRYLMLHRIKKKNDVNKDKWIGVGGKFEADEAPEQCLLRETWEETGLKLTSWKLRGILTFAAIGWESEYIFLYTADGFEGEPHLQECKEGTLEWIPRDQIENLNLWVGDRIFFHLLEQDRPVFSLKLVYDGDELVEASLDGERMTPPWEQYYLSQHA